MCVCLTAQNCVLVCVEQCFYYCVSRCFQKFSNKQTSGFPAVFVVVCLASCYIGSAVGEILMICPSLEMGLKSKQTKTHSSSCLEANKNKKVGSPGVVALSDRGGVLVAEWKEVEELSQVEQSFDVVVERAVSHT